jgi:hypothetical protein
VGPAHHLGIGGTGVSPVLAQAKACGYTLLWSSPRPFLQIPCRAGLGFRGITKYVSDNIFGKCYKQFTGSQHSGIRQFCHDW